MTSARLSFLVAVCPAGSPSLSPKAYVRVYVHVHVGSWTFGRRDGVSASLREQPRDLGIDAGAEDVTMRLRECALQ